ncbi:MAG TPA: hypothetical protein VNG13_02080 [Mycobacteriales bacterium]|nr:hypothetical protein [Mycobacteriales bacterium]
MPRPVPPGGDTSNRWIGLQKMLADPLREHPALKRSLRVGGYLLCGALLADVGYRASTRFSPERLRAADLALCLVLGIISWTALGCGWAVLSHRWIGPRAALWIWVRTQLLRYLPGAVWGPAARARGATTRLGQGVTLVVTESVLALGVASTVGSAVLAASASRAWVVAAAGGMLILAGTAGLSRRLGLGPGTIVAAIGCYVVSFLTYGAMALTAQVAVGPVARPGQVFGVSLIAWVAGVVVVTAPGGLGAREAAYVALLAGLLSNTGPLSAGAVAGRLVMLLSEVVVLAAVAAARTRRRSERRVDPSQPTQPRSAKVDEQRVAVTGATTA